LYSWLSLLFVPLPDSLRSARVARVRAAVKAAAGLAVAAVRDAEVDVVQRLRHC
jgi:hypothetical protein